MFSWFNYLGISYWVFMRGIVLGVGNLVMNKIDADLGFYGVKILSLGGVDFKGVCYVIGKLLIINLFYLKRESYLIFY